MIVVELGMCARRERAGDEAAERLRALIGARIRSAREARGLSLEELGYSVGIAPTYVAEVERGGRNPSALTLTSIARGLGVEVGLLFPSIQELGGAIDVKTKPRAKASPRPNAARETWLAEEVERMAQARDHGSAWLGDVRADKERYGRRAKKVGTLIGTGTAAKILGIDQRTLERRLEKNEIQPTDYVDNERAVFRREEVERLAQTQRQEVANPMNEDGE